MKKFLLGSTALGFALGLGLSAPAQADAPGYHAMAPKLKISGETIASVYWYRNSNPGDGHGKDNGVHLTAEDSSLNFEVEGRSDNLRQFEYSWLLSLTGDTAASKTVEVNRVQFRGDWGLVRLGDHQGVEGFMARGAYSLMGGTKGFDGNVFSVVNVPTGVLTGTDLVGNSGDATKATYVSPRFYGFQLGASYTPDTKHEGAQKLRRDQESPSDLKPFDRNHWAGGLNWMHTFMNGVKLTLSATGVIGHTKAPIVKAQPGDATGNGVGALSQRGNRHDSKSYALGGIVEWRNFGFGAEYIDNCNSQQLVGGQPLGDSISRSLDNRANDAFNAGKAYSFAANYTYGVDKWSVGYYASKRKFFGKDSKADIISATWDRQLAEGLSVFGEYNYLDLRTSSSAVALQNALVADSGIDARKHQSGISSNKVHAVIIGTKIKF